MTEPPSPDPIPEHELYLRAKVKEELRRRMKAVRRALPVEARRRRSTAIAERIIELSAFREAETVVAFSPLEDEVDLTQVIAEARARAKGVALPRVDWEREEIVVHVHPHTGELIEGAYGILEPPASAPVLEPGAGSLIVVPALAVDLRGHRIGYGRGFYDRLLSRSPRACSCAVAYDFQLVAEVPDLETDVPVDLIVTDARTVEIG